MKFKKSHLIHKGQYSEVWSAYRTDLQMNFALKILNVETVDAINQWDYESLFENEADLLARISHPCIIRFYDLVEDTLGRRMIVLEHGGTPLHQIDPHSITAESIAAMTVKILTALNYLQQPFQIGNRNLTSIVHGDIKPHNILVGNGEIKLIDFGSSCLPKELHSRTIAATPAYMRPERLRSKTEANTEDDLYALALTMSDALSKNPNQAGSNIGKQILSILKGLHKSKSIEIAIRNVADCIDKINYRGLIASLTTSPVGIFTQKEKP